MSRRQRYILFTDDGDPRLEKVALIKKGKLKSRPLALIAAHNSIFQLVIKDTALGIHYGILPMDAEKRKYPFDHIIFGKFQSRDMPDVRNFLWDFKTREFAFDAKGAIYLKKP